MLHCSAFQHLFEEGLTEKAYANTPVCDLRQYEQGRICEAWATKVLQEQNPEAEISDSELGTCCNGTRRGKHQTLCDFVLDNQRVEVKSTKMVWDSASRQWRVVFRRVKFRSGKQFANAFDDLYLVIVSPNGFHLIKRDLATGISTNGSSTEVSGHTIRITGSTSNTSWEEALRGICWKLCTQGGCSLIAQRCFDEPGFLGNILTERASICSRHTAALDGLPMSNMSNTKPGNRIQAIGLAIDQMLNPHAGFSFLQEGEDCSGRKRSAANASTDWVRGTTRVELKSASLSFDQTNKCWICLFQAIKPGLLDELWLAIYSPVGIHFYRSESIQALGLATSGAATALAGFQKCFRAPCGEGDQLKALEAIQVKMMSKGCQLVAVVEWRRDVAGQLYNWMPKKRRSFELRRQKKTLQSLQELGLRAHCFPISTPQNHRQENHCRLEGHQRPHNIYDPESKPKPSTEVTLKDQQHVDSHSGS